MSKGLYVNSSLNVNNFVQMHTPFYVA